MSQQAWTILAVMWFLVLVLIVAMFAAISRAASQPGAKRDALVGIKLSALKASDEAWRAGHGAAYAKSRTIALSVLPLGALALVLLAWVPAAPAVIQVVLMAVAIIWFSLTAARAARGF